jgi:cAMP phosphodiesterase
MKLQMLPSSIDENGQASARQHLLTIVIDDCVAIDAGCLAMSCSEAQRNGIRDILLTHTHLDHIAGLPLFVDDLFGILEEPIRIHATPEIVRILENDIFNWYIYPRFSELSNEFGKVVEYHQFARNSHFKVKHLDVKSVAVNHPVSANGYVFSDGASSVAVTGDTAETEKFWAACNSSENLKAVLVECAFPDEMVDLARVSDHLTPSRLKTEIAKLTEGDFLIYVINLKPMYRDVIIRQLGELNVDRLHVLEVGKVYNF